MAKSRALVLSLYLFFNSAVERGLAMGLGMLLSSTRTLSLSWSAVVEERRENVVVKAREGRARVLVAVRCAARARNMVGLTGYHKNRNGAKAPPQQHILDPHI